MASAARQLETYISPEEHERIELETGVKHEWYDGQIFAMAGAQPAHNTISANILRELGNQLRGQPWNSDQQIKIPARRAVLYPDVSVGCPPHECDQQHRNALTNPTVIIEFSRPRPQRTTGSASSTSTPLSARCATTSWSRPTRATSSTSSARQPAGCCTPRRATASA